MIMSSLLYKKYWFLVFDGQLPEGVGFPGDWSINLPRGEAVRRGDEVEEWARVMAPTGPLPAIHPGNMLEPERDVEKDSNATPSSFDSDKKFNLIKEISTRFLPDFASDENRALNIMVQEAERALRDVEVCTAHGEPFCYNLFAVKIRV